MEYNFFISIFLAVFLFVINAILKKFNISLDKISIGEQHKSLLRSGNSTPLSGTYFFLPITLFLFFQIDLIVVIFFSLFFVLGLLSDLKIASSYKLRLLFQFLFLSILFFILNEIIITTKIIFIDNLMNYDLTRILICTFFFMVLINGFNLIDGTNCLCSLNLLIITVFIFLLVQDLNLNYINNELYILIISLTIFLIFNFFGKSFLGAAASYGLSFFAEYVFL